VNPVWTSVLRGIVIVAGVAITLAGVWAFRLEDWPIYLTFVLLSVVLYRPTVEVLPGMVLPMPGLALSIGFLYVGGLPIAALNNAGSGLVLLVRAVLPERWRVHLPELRGGGTEFVARLSTRDTGAWADWAAAAVGLGARWGIVSLLVPGVRPATEPGAIIIAELGGYLVWTVLSLLPIFSFRSVLQTALEDRSREVRMDLGLVMLLALTPFVFLIAYGYERHGLAGAAAWSLSALGLHFMLKRLNERRVKVEEQNRRLEALNRELEHRERLSAIGKMSSVVSHQMLQQLGVIGIYADLIRNAEEADDPAGTVAEARRNAAAIEEALGGVNRVLRDLLVFSRDLRLNLYEHPLARVLEESVEECRAQAAERAVVLRLECPAEPSVTLDKLKVRQAVVNLVRNAIDASPAGADVVVRATVADGWAEIAVSDRGPGVPAPDREAVFTPFFTTKEQGTGLGLAIAREFTVAHGGAIAVSGRDGGGATFVLRLPRGGPAA
jgi:signal transduction histidine kinase